VRATSTLTGFRVDPATGTLTAIGSVPTERQPRAFNIDSSGRDLLAVGQLSHGLSSYAIDPGQRIPHQAQEVRMGPQPQLGRDRQPALRRAPAWHPA
jgi:6-phosphogluconolactonase